MLLAITVNDSSIFCFFTIKCTEAINFTGNPGHLYPHYIPAKTSFDISTYKTAYTLIG